MWGGGCEAPTEKEQKNYSFVLVASKAGPTVKKAIVLEDGLEKYFKRIKEDRIREKNQGTSRG